MNTPTPDFSLLEAALAIVRRAASGHPYANQAQLARATGVSEANISRWLSGKARPNLHKLEPVLNTLGVRLVAPEERPVEKQQYLSRQMSANVSNVRKTV